MPCCPDNLEPIKDVEEEIKKIQMLLAEAYLRAERLRDKVQCKRCLNRIILLIEGFEIFSKMNLFADVFRETSDKWREWIRRMAKEEGLEANNQL